MPAFWNQGTITLTTGSDVAVGQGNNFLQSLLRAGDTIESDDGRRATILSVDGPNAITFDKPWRGEGQVAAPYKGWFTPDDVTLEGLGRKALSALSSGNVKAFADLVGSANRLPIFTGDGTMGVINKADLISGVSFDAQVDTLGDRAAYDGEDEGFSVLVANIGDGRAALYFRTVDGWSDPSFLTGPAVTLDVTEVDEVPYGAPPAADLTPIAGGYNLAFQIPRGMIIEPGSVTTLAPDQPAAVNFVPIDGGFRLDISIPRGPTGDIDGVTPFWVTRLGADADVAAARDGLKVVSYEPQTLSPEQQEQARENIGVSAALDLMTLPVVGA